MYLYIYGCPCDASTNWDNAVSLYKRMNESDLSKLKLEKNCDKIEFKLDGEILFIV